MHKKRGINRNDLMPLKEGEGNEKKVYIYLMMIAEEGYKNNREITPIGVIQVLAVSLSATRSRMNNDQTFIT